MHPLLLKFGKRKGFAMSYKKPTSNIIKQTLFINAIMQIT